MIVVRVELLSAITGETTELARMHICNNGNGTAQLGYYKGKTLRGRDSAALDRCVISKTGAVDAFPRQSAHVWHLVCRMLTSMGYR